MSRTKRIDQLEDSEVITLATFIAHVGGRWRQILGHAWETGDYPRAVDAPALQRLRNARGPSLVLSLKTAEIQATAQEIHKEWSKPVDTPVQPPVQ